MKKFAHPSTKLPNETAMKMKIKSTSLSLFFVSRKSGIILGKSNMICILKYHYCYSFFLPLFLIKNFIIKRREPSFSNSLNLKIWLYLDVFSRSISWQTVNSGNNSWTPLVFFISVAFGAYAEHGFREVVTDEHFRFLMTAVRYNQVHSVVIAAIGLALLNGGKLSCIPALKWSGLLFIIGTMLFSFSIYRSICRSPKSSVANLQSPRSGPLGEAVN